MKLRKKTRKYRRQLVTTEDVLAAMEQRKVEVIYSWGAFGLNGLACRVGEIGFRFDYDVNPMYSADRYFKTHTEAEIAEMIAKEINGEGRLSAENRKYCIEFLSKTP